MNTFEFAKAQGLVQLQNRQGIGTLGERSLHAILKCYIDSNESHHEVPLGIGRLVADVFDGNTVTEIQTRGFSALYKKLVRILDVYPVNVIYPLTHKKRLHWVDAATGEISAPRKSPKTGSFTDAFRELYALQDILTHPQLTITLMLLDMDEYRLLNGWSADGKKGSHRAERIPTALVDSYTLKTAQDYAALLPASLPERFTTADVVKQARMNKRAAGNAVQVLMRVGAIHRVGKKGNAYLYEKCYT